MDKNATWLYLNEITPEIMEEYSAISPAIANRIQAMIDDEVEHQTRMSKIEILHEKFASGIYYAYLLLGIVGAAVLSSISVWQGSYAPALVMTGLGGVMVGVGLSDVTSPCSRGRRLRKEIHETLSALRVKIENYLLRASEPSNPPIIEPDSTNSRS